MSVEQLGFIDDAGQVVKAAGMALAAAGTDDWDRSVYLRAIRTMAVESHRSGEAFQMFDVMERFSLPEPRNHHQLGPLISEAARAGWIEAAGYAVSKRPTSGKSVLRVWRGTAEAAAA